MMTGLIAKNFVSRLNINLIINGLCFGCLSFVGYILYGASYGNYIYLDYDNGLLNEIPQQLLEETQETTEEVKE